MSRNRWLLRFAANRIRATRVTVGVASVSIYKYDSCTGTTLLDAAGLKDTLGAGEFQVSKQLDRASLTTTINVPDLVSGNSFDVNVNLDWTGKGDITRNQSNTNDIYPAATLSTAGRVLAATQMLPALSQMVLRTLHLPRHNTQR